MKPKDLLYYLVVIILILYIFIMTFNPEKMMDVFGFRTFVVLSDSMEPEINVMDVIVSKRIEEEDLEIGDIITFNVYIERLESEVFVTHYLGDIEEVDGVKTYKTRAISLEDDEFDEWFDEDGNPIILTYEDIEGSYLFKIPYLGFVQQALSNRIILALLIVNGGIIYFIIKVWQKDDDEEEYDE